MSGPLTGLKVLDFTRLLPGPFGTMLLGDMGAEVIKIEAANPPDLLRMMPPMKGGMSVGHLELNRNKKCITLDLKKPEGVEVVKRLVKNFDVLIEQFRPGVMEKLGVGHEELARHNEKLVYCSITGYGQDGPYRLRAGHDINYMSLSGVMSYTGRKDVGPVAPGIQVADQCGGGMNAVIAILAALYERERSGKGQYIDISMTDGAVTLGALHGANHLHGDKIGWETNVLNGGGYYGFYETGDGRYMSVGGLEPQFFQAMLKALGREDLSSFHLAMGPKGEKLKEELVKEFKKKTRSEWEEIFSKVDACVEPVLTVDEMAGHPHLEAREMVIEVEMEDGTPVRQIASPFKFSRSSLEYRHSGVCVGAHTRDILEESGFTDREIADLKSKNVVK